MALSGKIKSSTATAVSSDKYPRHLVLDWTATQSIEDNTSTISYTIKAGGTETGKYCNTGPITVKINGKTVYSKTSRFRMKSKTVLKTGEITITHNNDGTLTVPVSISAAIYTYAVSSTYKGNITLNTIPRASDLAITPAKIGENPTINISRYSSKFTHTLTYEGEGLSGTILDKSTKTTITDWTIPVEFYEKIPNAKYALINFTLDTYNGSTLVGTKRIVRYKAYISDDSIPTLNPDVRDINPDTVKLTGDDTKLIRFYSNANATTNPVAVNGASIKSCKITHSSTVIDAETHTFEKVENGVFDFTTTDTRGISASSTITRDVIPYIKLTCGISKVSANAEGEIVVRVYGNFYAGSFGAETNALTVQVRIKEGYGEYGEWEGITYDTDTDNFELTVTKTGLDYRQIYTIQARAIDKLGYIDSVELPVRCIPVFDWGEEDFNLNVELKMNEQTVLRHNRNANNTVLSASGGFIYFRPGGTNDTSTEIKFTPQGNIELKGTILVNGINLIDALEAAGII